MSVLEAAAQPQEAGQAVTIGDLPGWSEPTSDAAHAAVHAALLAVCEVAGGDLLCQGGDGWAVECWGHVTPEGRPAVVLTTTDGSGRWWTWARLVGWRPDDADAPSPRPCFAWDAEVAPLDRMVRAARVNVLTRLDTAADAVGVL